jgi:RHS repeat-associated protein
MKKHHLLTLLALGFSLLLMAQGQHITLDQPITGGQHTYTASESIRLLPGFSYKPVAAGDYFVGEIGEPITPIPPIEFLSKPIGTDRQLDYSLEVGSISGDFHVDLRGSAIYTIPIVLPPGTKGFIPKIELKYSSELKNGYLGKGWGIAGLSTIRRTEASMLHDGFVAGITMTKQDRYELNGERLIVVMGDNGDSDSEYRTANETFNKITSFGQNNAGPDWFIVESKKGFKSYYGDSQNSKRLLPQSEGVYEWLLRRIEDNQGNYIDFYYRFENNYAYIDEIKYTGNSQNDLEPYNVIKFNYGRFESYDYYYLVNDRVLNDLLITSIEIISDNASSINYHFDYYRHFSPMLNQIVYETDDGSSYNSTVFSYQEAVAQPYNGPNLSINSEDGSFLTTSDFNNNGRSDFISINDNNVQNSYDLPNRFILNYYHNSLEGPRKKHTFEQSNASLYGEMLEKYVLGDFNGDGYLDIALALRDDYLAGDKHWTVQVLKNDPSNGDFIEELFNQEFYPGLYSANNPSYGTKKTHFDVGDFNGDGKDELLLVRRVADEFELNIVDYPTTSSLFSVSFNGYPFDIKVGDFDGDGIDEIMILDESGYSVYGLSSFNIPEAELILVVSDEVPKVNSEVLTGIFNKDTKTDLLVHDHDIGEWRLFISNGKGFVNGGLYGANLSPPGYYGMNVKIVTDFDGDGLSDIIDYANSDHNQEFNLPETIGVYYNRGEGIFATSVLQVPESIVGAPNRHLIWGDFDGNGSVELLYNQYQLVKPDSPFPLPYPPDEIKFTSFIIDSEINLNRQLLKAVVNGLNHKTTIYYNYAAFGKLINNYEPWEWMYSFNTNLPQPYFTSKKAKYLVDRVLIFGGNQLSKKSYTYRNPIYNLYNKQFKGFERVSINRNKGETSVYEKTLFTSIDALLESEISEFSRTGELVRFIELRHEAYNPFNQSVWFTYVRQENSTDFLNNVQVVDVFEYSSSDILHGNLSKRTSTYTKSGNLHGTTITNYSNYIIAGSWCPSKPEDISTVYSKPQLPDILRRNSYEYYTNGSSSGLLKKVVLNTNLTNPVVIQNKYNEFGNLSLQEISGGDFELRTSRYLHDDYGRYPTSVFNALDHNIQLEYDAHFGNLTKITDEIGLETNFQHDSFGKLKHIEYPDGRTVDVAFEWNDTFLTSTYHISTQEAGKGITKQFYDDIGQQVGASYQDFHGNQANKLFKYNEYGQLIRESEFTLEQIKSDDIQWTNYAYDANNRLNSITSALTDISISHNNNKTRIHDNKLERTSVLYHDAKGNLTELFEMPDNQISYFYDAESKLLNTNVNGVNYVSTYDEFGFPETYYDQSVGLIEYEFNSIGNLLKKTDSKGDVFEYTYDVLNRVKNEIVHNGRSLEYIYDQTPISVGALNEVRSSDNVIFQYEYDQLGRLSSESESVNGDKLSFIYHYDQLSRLSQIVYPNNLNISHEYNAYGYLNKITNVNDNKLLFQVLQSDLYGRPLEYEYGNNTVTSRSFDSVNRIIEDISVNSPFYGSTDIFSLSYSICPRRNIIDGRIDNIRNLAETFTYDPYQRLTNVTGIGNVPSIDFQYTSNGNISETNHAIYSYANNIGNHAVSALELKSGSSISHTAQSIEYTAFNKLSRIIEGDFEYLVKYGPDNRRKETQHFESGLLQKTKRYMKSFEKVTDAYGISENSFIFGPAGLVAIHQKMNNKEEQIFYAHSDHLGSVMGFTDDSGAIVQGSVASFDAWGNRRDPETWQPYTGTPPALLFDRGYTGHEHIEQAGLINMNGRVYDPLVARFLSPDPFIQAPAYSQSFNRYSYVMNDPINLVDRSGYYWEGYDEDYDDYYLDGDYPNVNPPRDDIRWFERLFSELSDAWNEIESIWNDRNDFDESTDFLYTEMVDNSGHYFLDDQFEYYDDLNRGERAANSGGDYAWGGVLAFAAAATVADGPIPIGDAIALATIGAYGTYVLADKMAAEISRIAEKVNNTRGFVYELRANQPGTYINVRGVPVQMNAGDVWKYGETTSMYRYSGPELDYMIPGGVHRVDIFPGNVAEIKIQEKIMIYGYYFQHGYLPPGNKIFR